MRDFLRNLIHLTPATSNAWRYWHVYPNTLAACRGVYGSWQEASQAAKRRHRLARPAETPTFRAPEGVAIHPLAERDYPIMLHLAPLLAAGTRVLNVGGSLAKEYASYRKLIRFPDGLEWRICEMPEIVAAGNEMLAAADYPGLSFSTGIGGEADIFLICGALQYLEPDLPAILRGLDRPPAHVFVSRTPMQDRVARFYTVQNNGSAAVPYRIDNEGDFLRSMAVAGYRLVDGWRDSRKMVIPYYPGGTVNGYLGFYFAREDGAPRPAAG